MRARPDITMSKRWIVGVEPDGTHDGPLYFAASMHRRSRPPIELSPIHVVPSEDLIGAEERTRLEVRSDPACRAALVRADAREAVTKVELAEAEAVDTGLQQAVSRLDAVACVIGRRALRKEIKLQRLGPVARRMLRRLPTAMIVVPPDWIAVHDGPVILATDLGPASEGAAVFAHELARTLVTPLVVTHVSRHGDWTGPHFEGAVFQARRHRLKEEAKQELDGWAHENGLGDAVRVVHLGDPVSDIAAFANEEKASLIVCGSRGLGSVVRFFGHSVASELAAVAAVPVAVVPEAESA